MRFSAWNLLLLVPFLVLLAPWLRSVEPRLFGIPLFYWTQLAWVPVGVICAAVVYTRTRRRTPRPNTSAPADSTGPGEGSPR